MTCKAKCLHAAFSAGGRTERRRGSVTGAHRARCMELPSSQRKASSAHSPSPRLHLISGSQLWLRPVQVAPPPCSGSSESSFGLAFLHPLYFSKHLKLGPGRECKARWCSLADASREQCPEWATCLPISSPQRAPTELPLRLQHFQATPCCPASPPRTSSGSLPPRNPPRCLVHPW